MKIVFDIPDDKIQLVVDAFADTQGYQETVTNNEGIIVSNPETPQTFAKKCIGNYIKTIVHMHERKLNEQAFILTEIVIT